jgi:hypothetical protein
MFSQAEETRFSLRCAQALDGVDEEDTVAVDKGKKFTVVGLLSTPLSPYAATSCSHSPVVIVILRS